MNIKRVYNLYEIIKAELPSTYMFPKLAFFQDEKCMLDNAGLEQKENENVYAIVDPDTNTIHIPLRMNFIYINSKGEDYSKDVSINKFDDCEIAHTLLHELGHIYYGERYGYNSKKYNDEKACDVFAYRWVRRLKKRKLL